MRINKKFLQVLAALWILVFHVWIGLGNSILEQFILRIGYVGVDLFFFVAAYSLTGNVLGKLEGVGASLEKKLHTGTQSRDFRYGPFIKNRFARIYGKFFLFTLVAAVYKGWSFARTGKVLIGLEFLEKGGGSFLWFLPAIMLFYLIVPPVIKKTGAWTPVVLLLLWALLGCLFQYGLGYKDLFIFVNRIPVMAVGCMVKLWELRGRATQVTEKMLLEGSFLLLIPGLSLLYRFGAFQKLHVPFWETYYILGIFLVLALVGISTRIPDTKVMSLLGSATLELYALQMIFGTKLAGQLYKLTGQKLLTNLLSILILWSISIVIAKAYAFALGGIAKKKTVTV